MNAGCIGQPEEFNFRRVRAERENGTPGRAYGEKPVRKIQGRSPPRRSTSWAAATVMRRQRAVIAMKRGRSRNYGPRPACLRDPRADVNRDGPRRRTARRVAPGPSIGRSFRILFAGLDLKAQNAA